MEGKKTIMELDDFGKDYIRLALQLDKHIDGFVDAYLGDPSLKAEVDSADKKSIPALIDDLADLKTRIPSDDPQRELMLKAVFRALDCTLQMQNGVEFDFLDEVNRLYDVSPTVVDESVFTDAHNTLDSLLEGAGTISERLQARQAHYIVAEDKLLDLMELARDETRKRTAKLIDLPDDEYINITLVKNQPWGAYNWYKGNGQSLVEINTDMPFSALGLIGLFAHEAYPGHHVEGLLKEKLFCIDKNYAEQAVPLLNSPAGVIAEAIATTAVEIIFPDDSHYDWTHEVILPNAGIETDETPETIAQISKSASQLRYVRGNASIMYHRGELDRDGIIDYLATYALISPERAEKSLDFMLHPLYRSYGFTYTVGYDLLAHASKSDDKISIFKRLLTEQLLPSQLQAMGDNGA